MAGNPFITSNLNPSSFQPVVPSDTVQLGGFKVLRIGVAGNLTLKGMDGISSGVMAVASGEYVPFGAGLVMATGTTATGIVAMG